MSYSKWVRGKKTKLHMNDFCILPYIRNTSSCTRVPSLQFQRTIPSVFFNNVLFTGKKNAVSYSEVLGGRSSTLLGPSLPLGLFLHLPLRSASRRSNSTGIFLEGKQVCIPHREKLQVLTEVAASSYSTERVGVCHPRDCHQRRVTATTPPGSGTSVHHLTDISLLAVRAACGSVTSWLSANCPGPR